MHEIKSRREALNQPSEQTVPAILVFVNELMPDKDGSRLCCITHLEELKLNEAWAEA